MPSFWQQMPFVRILIAFLMGILLADKAQANYQHACILATLPLFIIFYNKKISNKLNTPIPTGLAYFILFICLGIFCLNQQKTSFWVKHFSQEKYQAILVQTEQKPQLTKNGWKAEAFVIAGYTKHFKPQKCKGKIVIYSKNSPSFPKGYGHQFLIKSGIQEIVFNKNPGSFNFQEYMNRKGIFHQCYLNENTAQFIAKNQGNRILTQIFSFQDFIHQSLQENLLGKNEIAIAEALLYGYDKEIDDTVSDAFSKTGTLHVLAVSGMHVGLIFMLLSWLLTPLLKLKRGKLYVAIFQTIGIWLYAVLCGLSPSILRACVMFSFVIFGKQLNRSSNPFNSLSAAGFLLLAMQPLMLYNVGFQLSFAAVGGILGFYPYLNLWIQFKHTLLNEIWKIIAISLAAQTLTIPISIYYFHQFPNYFLLANLIIIPLSTLIIYGGILFLVCTPIKIVASAIGYVISKLITLTTAITIQIANLPYSSIENIIWSIPFIFSYYLIGILIIHYFSTRNISSLKAILLLLLLLSLFGLNQTFTQNNTQKLYILASKQNLVILAHQKHVLQIWHRANDSLETKKNWVQPYTMKYPIKKEIWQHIDSINYQLKLGKDKTLYILQQSALPAHLHPTLLLITGKNRQALAPILKHNTIQKVILHSDVPLYRKNIYKEILNKNKIPYHDITENGAFEVSL